MDPGGAVQKNFAIRNCLCVAIFIAAVSYSHCEEATYELHEWGVFPVPRSAAWTMLDTRVEIAGMPKFFCKVWPDQHLPCEIKMAPVWKPVIYLYPTQALDVNLKIRFENGRPLVWWPAAKTSPKVFLPSTKELEFEIAAKPSTAISPLAGAIWPPFAPIERGHWIEALRNVSSAMLQSKIADGLKFDDNQIEKFIYYDGLMKAPDTPQIARDGDAIVISSNFPYAISDLMVIDRDEKRVRIGKEWIGISAGQQTARLELISISNEKSDAKTLSGLAEEFVSHLVAAGLTKEEAVGLEKVWREGLFHHDGLSIFYRVPQSVYDAWLPLTANPKPTKTVRVGLVLHQHLEPELRERVTALIKKLSAETFDERQDAKKSLLSIGGAAFPFLEAAARNKDADAETAANCRSVIEALDARPALNIQAPRKDIFNSWVE
jgi:hypothetical protein